MRNLTTLIVATLLLIAGAAFAVTLTVANKSATTIPAYRCVSPDTAFVAVTAKTGMLVAIDSNVAVADSLHNSTMPAHAKIIPYRIRVRFVAGDAADTNRHVYIYGRDISGITITPYYRVMFSHASSAKDSYTDFYMSKVTAVTATGSHANDSVQVFAEMPMPVRLFSDSNQYSTPFLGVTQESIPSRHLGTIKVVPDSSYIYVHAAVRAGYFIYPGDDSAGGGALGTRIMPDSGYVIGVAPRGSTAGGNVWVRMLGTYWFHR